MRTVRMISVSFLLLVVYNQLSAQHVKQNDSLAWKQGYLDIHHISTGRGNACFIIFPDGTTMLVDAGDLDTAAMNKALPIKVSPVKPNSSKTAAQWIVNYIKQVMPAGNKWQIDYALITHYHPDHFGTIEKKTRKSQKGNYKLSGITEVAEYIPIRKMLDRGYSFPAPVKQSHKVNYPTFENYLSFTQQSRATMITEQLKAGSDTQIKLNYSPGAYPEFKVRNIKCNGTIWTGNGDETKEFLVADSMLDKKGEYPENPLSLAIKLSYGKFDYYTGGDNTGLKEYDKAPWFDVETPIANAVGQVEAMSLNHHGNRDATNGYFLQTLCPKIIIGQSWCSDHPGMEVFHRMASSYWCGEEKLLFATTVLPETKVTYGPWFVNAYASMEGHVMIRVKPGGDEYSVYVIDDKQAKLSIKKVYGPFISR